MHHKIINEGLIIDTKAVWIKPRRQCMQEINKMSMRS